MNNIDMFMLEADAKAAKRIKDNLNIKVEDQAFPPFKEDLPALSPEDRAVLTELLLSEDPDPAAVDYLIKKGLGELDDPAENEAFA